MGTDERRRQLARRVVLAEDDREALRDAVLILLAGTFYTETITDLQGEHPEIDAAVDHLFERKLIDTRRDPCDDTETFITDAGDKFIRAALLAATSTQPTKGDLSHGD